MRNAVIDRQFQHLRIDHDQAALFGLQPVDQAQDHRVDRDRLAGAGGAGDQQMRHAREIDDHRFAADGLAEAERQLCRGFVIASASQHLAQIDLLAVLVRQFDADGVAARHDGDARRHRAHRAGDVVGKADDARRFDAGRGLQFVKRDHRTRPRIDDLALDAEILKHAFERLGVFLDFVIIRRGALAGARRRQKRQRRQRISAGPASRRPGTGAARGARPRRCLVILVVELLPVHFRAFRSCQTRLQSRNDAFGRAEQAALPVASRKQPCQARLETKQRVDQPADRDRGFLFLGGKGFGFAMDVVAKRSARPQEQANRDADRGQHQGTGNDGEKDARGHRGCAAGERKRQSHHGIADHAAEARRQGPVGAARNARCETRGEGGAGKPKHDAQYLTVERAMRHEPPAPQRHWQNQHDSRETEQLHQEIRGNRAGKSKQVANRRVGGMTQAWIAHRPGRERERGRQRQRDQQQPA